jgi:hypothetical protein
MAGNFDRLRQMFDEMVIPKQASRVPDFYDPDFVMETNQIRQGYREFLADHEAYYESDLSYEVEYDHDSVVDEGDKLACRLWVTTARPGTEPTRIEVMLIARFRGGKILRLWELTLPNWATLAEFDATR